MVVKKSMGATNGYNREKNMRGDISVAISLGKDIAFAITNENNLICHHVYAHPNLAHSIPLGRCTKRRIEELQEYLERLKCHAVEE